MITDEWTDTDNDIWTDNDYYIWIPTVSPDGAAMFVCTGLIYEFEGQDHTYMYSSQNNIYQFAAREI